MLLLYHNLNKFATFLFIFFIVLQSLTQITESKKRRKIILNFLAETPPKNGQLGSYSPNNILEVQKLYLNELFKV